MMKPLTKEQYNLWDEKASKFLTHNPNTPCREYCLALRDAIHTLVLRDAEIAQLKGKT